jgi:hypothetical protein
MATTGAGYVHWIAGAGAAASAVGRYLLGDAENEVKGLPQLVSRSVVKGHPVSVYHYPSYPAGGPNGGHSAAFVRCRGGVVFASIHGYRNDVAAISMAVDLAGRTGCR